MRFPKDTRELIYESQGDPVEIAWPFDGGEPKAECRYTVQSSHRAGERAVRVLSVRRLGDGAYVAMVKLDDDPIRLLRKTNGYGESVEGALPVDPDHPAFEPEGVSEEDQREITREADERFRQGRLGFLASRERLGLGDRLDDVLEEARRQGLNISPKVRVIERQIQAMERQLYERSRAA